MTPPYRFLPASPVETIVYGAERPGYGSDPVEAHAVLEWLAHMQARQVRRVCCLLPTDQLAYYTQDLLATYGETFGEDNVCWAPVKDFHLCDPQTLTKKILPFLLESDRLQARVVVHCSGGLGRTGHILAAWLVSARDYSAEDALTTVTSLQREPREAVGNNATENELQGLLRTAVEFGQSYRH